MLPDILNVPALGNPPIPFGTSSSMPNPFAPSKSEWPISYFFLLSLSDNTPYAQAISLNFLVAQSFSAPDFVLFLSGWYLSARLLQAFLIQSQVAFFETPRMAQKSFFLAIFSFFFAYWILALRLEVGSSCQTFAQSCMAPVQSYRSIFTYALLINDFVQFGQSSKDLFRSSKAFRFCFLFIKVKALFEKIIAFSFLLKGSKFSASVYFAYASAYLFAFINQFPSYFNFSHLLVLFKHYLHFAWSGSSCRPSEKYFFAFKLSPLQSYIIPFRQQTSGSFPDIGSEFNCFPAQSVSPVLARASIRYTFSILHSGSLLVKYVKHDKASVKSLFFQAYWYLLKLVSKCSYYSSSFFKARLSLSQAKAPFIELTASLNFSIWARAEAFFLQAFTRVGDS